MRIISKSEKETFTFGQELATTLKGGEILALFGDLGSGKTTFTKGLALGLGIKKTITSPTFNIMKVYPVDKVGIKKLIHIDAYRLSNDLDVESIGLPEMIGDKDYLIIIEWPQNIWSSISGRARKIEFNFVDEFTREINY